MRIVGIESRDDFEVFFKLIPIIILKVIECPNTHKRSHHRAQTTEGSRQTGLSHFTPYF